MDEKYQRLMGQADGMSNDNEQLKGDLCKANDIIQRKMDEVKQLKYKYRRNEEVIKKQEELLNQKDQDMKVGLELCSSCFLKISRFLKRILMKHIDMKNSLDSKLKFFSIRPFRLRPTNLDIVKKPL